MLTPLDAEEGLDRPAVFRIVEFLLAGGTNALFILGTNGEGATLRPAVRHALAEAAVEAARGRVPVLAGVLEPGTARVEDEVRALAGRGLAGYVATVPYYFPWYGEADVRDHFRRIADAADRPLLLYNIPQATKLCLKAESVLQLAGHPNIVGLKDSAGDWAEFQAVLFRRPSPAFAVLQGAHPLSAVSLLAGADGLVPGYANMHPRLMADMIAAAASGDPRATLAHQATLDQLLRVRGRANIHSNKLLCKAQGLMDDHVTAPLPRLTPQEAEKFLAECRALGLPPSAAT
jgi:4-hydroxy-tetrahydrodipicolinate synthase